MRGRRPYAHEATVALPADGDARAPGAAITLALCGSWTHDPPCPLAPHHTRADRADRAGGELALRVLFAADPADEARVRQLVDAALGVGRRRRRRPDVLAVAALGPGRGASGRTRARRPADPQLTRG